MTKARIRPFGPDHNINIGYFEAKEVDARSVTENIYALYSFNNHFCLICKSETVSFNKVLEKLKSNLTKVNRFTSLDTANFCFK